MSRRSWSRNLSKNIIDEDVLEVSIKIHDVDAKLSTNLSIKPFMTLDWSKIGLMQSGQVDNVVVLHKASHVRSPVILVEERTPQVIVAFVLLKGEVVQVRLARVFDPNAFAGARS